MKKIFLTLVAGLAIVSSLHAQIQFKVAEGIDEGKMKDAIEHAMSGLLTEVNEACAQHRDLALNRLQMTNEAKFSISMLWENVPFECIDPVVVERVLRTPAGGYQVRSIPLMLQPSDAGDISEDDAYQEAVVEFNAAGKIISFYFGLKNNAWKDVMRSGSAVTDSRHRMMILDYVEHFRTAYNQHDINFLEQVFSDDAIIITGKVTTTKKSDIHFADQTKIEYVVQNKQQYLSRLKTVFARNKYINVEFSQIQVASHPTRKDFYGVTVKQDYSSSTYSDEGYVFLLWDFRDETHPQIHVRTWQPYWLDNNKTQTLPEDEVFDISSFDLSSVDY